MELAADRSHTPKGRHARERILAAAERLFTEHGFHGTSMRDVASAAGFPLATTIYHFARKEQLYATVLDTIGVDLVAGLEASQAGRVGAGWAELVDAFALALVSWTQRHPGRVKLLLRELLDNPARVAKASRLPLAPFLDRATGLLASAAREHAIVIRDPQVAVLHLVGGLSYVVAARPTVVRITGRIAGRERARLGSSYEAEAIAFARDVLGVVPSAKEPSRGPRTASSTRPPRARTPRAQDHRRRGRA